MGEHRLKILATQRCLAELGDHLSRLPPGVVVCPLAVEEERGRMATIRGAFGRILGRNSRALEAVADGTTDAEALLLDWSVGHNVEDILTSCPRVKWIHVIQTGVDHLPLDKLRERRLMVTCARGAYSAAVAEFAVGLLYLFAKRYLVHYRLNQQGKGRLVWNDALSEQTMIVFGTGAIGQHIAQLARPSGMKIIGVNRDGHAVPGFDVVSAPTDINAFCQEADYVVNCLPLTWQTQGYFGAERFAWFKKAVCFITVGRLGTVDTAALIQALDGGSVAWAALDIGPLSKRHPLRGRTDVFVTNYSAYATSTRRHDLAMHTLRNIQAYLAGGELEGVVDLEKGY